MKETDDDTKRCVVSRKSRPVRMMLKIAAWFIMSVALFIFGVLVATVKILTPQRLTPIVEHVADKMLDADVSVSCVELSMKGSFPFISLDVDSISVLPRSMRGLAPQTRGSVPQWADTLISIGHFHGGINIPKFVFRNEIDLSDIVITRPAVNIAIIDDSRNNFNIFKPSEDTDEDTLSIPAITFRKFEIIDPGPVRYIDLESGQEAVVSLSTVRFDGNKAPLYVMNFGSDISSPLLEYLSVNAVPVGFDGEIGWDRERPYSVSLKDFDFKLAVLSGRIDTSVDFGDGLMIDSLDLRLAPLQVSELLSMMPDSIAKEWGIPSGIKTSASVGFNVRLTEPYSPGQDVIPHAELDIELEDCYFYWDKLRLDHLAATLGIELNGDDLDETRIRIGNLLMAGPATTLRIKGTVSELISDPLFDVDVSGNIRLDRLPAILTRNFGGTLSGRLVADTHINARPSMFDRNTFHRLKVKGDIDLDDFSFVAGDSLNTVYLDRACFRFGTNERVKTEKVNVDSLLTASIEIDSASVFSNDMSMRITDFRLGVGTVNKARSSDSTMVIPIGGGLKIGKFNMIAVADSSMVRLRDVNGQVVLKRFEQQAHLPELIFNLDVRRFVAGGNTSRVMLSNSNINLNAHKLPERKSAKRIRAIADSIRPFYTDISNDSLYVLAMEIYRNSRGRRNVTPAMTKDDSEVIDWEVSRDFRRLLLNWDIRGSVSAKRVRLFTPYFPLRNRITNFNMAFCNDSVILTNVKYKAGQSDFNVSGTVSNIKRAIASRRVRSPLKVYLDLNSDTIDVNELADATFKGASYAENGDKNLVIDDTDNEEEFERKIDESLMNAPDSTGPLLIPTNIDAELRMRADNVFYSNLEMRNFSGSVLAYDGALNLRRLGAGSDVGSIDLSALYSAPSVDDMKFGFGLKVRQFNINSFLDLVPAVDSLMPLMRDFSGIIDADIAATSDIDREMNLVLPSLNAAIKLEGDSLVLIDEETFKIMAKWLMFKNKKLNMIDHMSVELVVEDNKMQLFPFMFDLDRYRLGVQGYNDLAMNFDYHVSVLKSPLPFKFGINIKGNPDDYKIRLGRAKFNEKTSMERVAMVDTTRVNLLNQIENVFRRGVRNSRLARLELGQKPRIESDDIASDTISHADSLIFIREGLITAPVDTIPAVTDRKGKAKNKKNSGKSSGTTSLLLPMMAVLPASRRNTDKHDGINE